jgi:methionine-rich copper-binding protein CopC
MTCSQIHLMFPKPLKCLLAACTAIAILSAASVALFDDGVAYAHAQLIHAEPPAGVVLSTAPNQVMLKFNEKLEPIFSSIVVRDALGMRVDNNDAYIDKSNAIMRITLQPLPPGAYIVQWRALSVSTHKTQGAFVFRVTE